jgi:hypothetical protein
MEIRDLAQVYEKKSDDELIQLGVSSQQLTREAQAALTIELARRRIDAAQFLRPSENVEETIIGRRLTSGTFSAAPLPTAEFVAEVYRVYRNHLWLFTKLAAPAVVLGYAAAVARRNELREIAARLPRGFELTNHKADMLEMWLLSLGGYLVIWLGFSFSFGAICSATDQIATGNIPSVLTCFSDIRRRIGSFLHLSLLLSLLFFVLMGVSVLIMTGVFSILHQVHYHLGSLAIQIVSFGIGGLAMLVFSRFGLAVPALILGHCTVGQAVFRSDELSEGKWTILAVLLSKSLLGGYVAAMLPFWLTAWLWTYVQFPRWFPELASITAVSFVEPFMFIGLALLYLRTSMPRSALT